MTELAKATINDLTATYDGELWHIPERPQLEAHFNHEFKQMSALPMFAGYLPNSEYRLFTAFIAGQGGKIEYLNLAESELPEAVTPHHAVY
jgi:hypothetical protein